MKKTAVQEVFSELENLHPHLFNIYSSEGKQFVNHFHKYLEIEREQMINFAEFVARYSDKNKNVNGEMLHAKSKYDGAERTVDLLETFKKE